MYCNDCKHYFDEPDRATEYYGEVDDGNYATYSVCPICHSDDIEDSDYCICGAQKKYFADYCEDCEAFIHSEVEAFLNEIKDNLKISHKEALELLTHEIERRN